MKFDTYAINSTLKNNLKAQGLIKPTDIQYKAIPSILKGEDVLAIAQTGTGKTVAFAVPVINTVLNLKRTQRNPGIQSIIMVPTRELAVQIQDVFMNLCRKTKVKPFAVFGGVEQDKQIQTLIKGVDILIATPGRMFDLISQKAIDIRQVKILILDEADQMLDKGFLEDIQCIKRLLKQRHQTLFFSATINKNIKKLAYSQVKSSAVRIQISPEDPVSKNVSHYVISVEMDDKRFFLRKFIRENPDSKILVFVRTTVRAERVAKALERANINALTIYGKKEQDERLAVLDRFKQGEDKILIATDVSARGIDIPNVDYVINYDLPEQKEMYVHRIGRTGRGRSKGKAISFCSSQEKDLLTQIQDFLGKQIETIKVSKDEYAFTVEVTETSKDIREMILANEKWEKKKGRRKKK
ncbi:DEAD/DEAH box helicase [uncultured Desulfobacter sp.]|uniref:DEAD/DEAH box helicase n=1 Tax=uncultured Desulfobacter sp. TaxID=240139 RepID=UPI0029F47373|nr:DEAD/DEAH box helicase [uncultured Desulfobacter sp.]